MEARQKSWILTGIWDRKPWMVGLISVLNSTLKSQPKSRLTLRTFLPASGCLLSSAAGSVGIRRLFVRGFFFFSSPTQI